MEVEKLTRLNRLGPGLLLAFGFAVLSFATWWFTKGWFKISALMWAFIYSIIATNLISFEEKYKPGIEFSASTLLKFAIACLGIVVSALAWWRLGGVGIASVLINLGFAFTFGIFFCRYVLGLGGALTVLISAGTCICGASAIAATSPAIKSKSEETGVALATVTLFGLIAMFLYPFLFSSTILGNWLLNNVNAFGVWSGIGIHETAQVIASGSQIEGALDIAILTKSIRIFMIGPMVFISVLVFRKIGGGAKATGLSIPWFAVIFVVLTFVHAGLELSIGEGWTNFSKTFLKPPITFLLAWSFAGVGFKVKFKDIAKLGPKAFLGGLTVAMLTGLTGLLLVKYLWLPLH